MLNVYYMFTQMTVLQWRVFRLNNVYIALRYFVPFVLLGFFIFGLGRFLISEGRLADTVLVWVVLTGCVIGYLGAGYWLLEPSIQSDIIALFTRFFRVFRRPKPKHTQE